MIRRMASVAALLVIAAAQPGLAQVAGVRHLPQSCEGGESVVVGLDLQVGESVPNGVIVVETLPEGWTFQSAVPAQSSYNESTRELRWVFWGGAVNSEAMDIEYTVTAAPPGTFAGNVLFNDPPGTPQTIAVGGASRCSALVVCTGDCDGDGAVTIDEVVRQILIGLGAAPAGDCSAGDGNGDGTITVDEVVSAVNNALTGCRRGEGV